jgi:murein DD-endopeptidase MepM/ murein hydrolase activator NlpD
MHRNLIFSALILSTSLAAVTQVSAQPPELHGTLEQGALVTGKVVPGTRVELDGKPVRVAPSGVFAIGFDRDAKPQAQLTLIAASGQRSAQTLSIQQRQYDIQRVTGVPQQTVEPPPEQLQRILEEQKWVEQARAVDSDREDFSGPFQWPLQGPISGVYGSQRFYNGKAGRPHFGVDVAAPVGTVVRAPAAATVTLAQPDLFFSGGTLIMDHGYGVSSTFMHLSRLLVKSGERVAAGQPVAEVGATGRATGPHLDWRINWFSVRLDPQTVVSPRPAPPMPISGAPANAQAEPAQ